MSKPLSRRSLLAGTIASSALADVMSRDPRVVRSQSIQPPGKIAFTRSGSIWVWTAGVASELLAADNISDPRWNPDGDALLYVRMQNSYSDLYLLDLITNVETQLTFNQPVDEIGSLDYATNSSWVLDPDWARSGLIAFASDVVGSGGFLSLWLMASTAETPYLALQTVLEDDISGVCLAPQESLAAYTVRTRMGDGAFETYVALRDLNNGSTAPVAESNGDIFDSAISPDGAWIAVTIRDGKGVTDIWLVDRATSERRRGTRNENAMAPRWSDDGKWLAYLRMHDFEFEIWAGQFLSGRIRDAGKLFDDTGINSQSGLSWWTPVEDSPATAGA